MSVGWDDEFVVLPDTTSDESDRGWGDPEDAGNEARLVDERPPHWE